MVYRGSDETVRGIIAELISEMEPRGPESSVKLPVMTLDDLVDDDGELRRVGVSMATGTQDDVQLLHLLVRIAIISPECESDKGIRKMAERLDDVKSLAWTYACGIGTDVDDIEAIRLFRSDEGLTPIYSGLWRDPSLLLMHSFIRNRIDMPDGYVSLEDIFSRYLNAEDELERLVYGTGIVVCLNAHDDLDTAFRAVSQTQKIPPSGGDILQGIFEAVYPLTYCLRDAPYLDDRDRAKLRKIEDFVSEHSAEWKMSTASSLGYLRKRTPMQAVSLMKTGDASARERLRAAMTYCPERIVITWLESGDDPLEMVLRMEDGSLIPEPLPSPDVVHKSMEDDIRTLAERSVASYSMASPRYSRGPDFLLRRNIRSYHNFRRGHPDLWDKVKPTEEEISGRTRRRAELKKAYSGDVTAQFNAGVTAFEESRYEDAMTWFTIASMRDLTEAQLNLALMYLEGVGMDPDQKRGIEWMTDSALGGDTESCSFLGYAFREDRSVENVDGVTKSDRISAMWNWVAASFGDGNAQFNLAVMYEFGLGVEQSMEHAISWYRRAISNEVPEALYNLGNLYYQGKGVQQSDGQALELYARASRLGDRDAMCNLASMIWKSRVNDDDESKAISLFERAGEMGCGLAYHNLGSIFDMESEIHHSKGLAVSYYEKAIELGEINSLINLGLMYEQGDGVEKDLSKAAELYQRVAESSGAECNDCRSHLAFMYMRGDGVEKSPDKCIRLFEEAAELGDEKSMYNLGAIYDNGDIVEESIETAVEWYKRAADNGSSDAASALGEIYQEGYGVDASEETAKYYFGRAEELDKAQRLYSLGNRYRSERDMESAIAYFQSSASLGNRHAAQALNDLGIKPDRSYVDNGLDIQQDLLDDPSDYSAGTSMHTSTSQMVIRPSMSLRGRITT